MSAKSQLDGALKVFKKAAVKLEAAISAADNEEASAKREIEYQNAVIASASSARSSASKALKQINTIIGG